jgi:hypothetical protein
MIKQGKYPVRKNIRITPAQSSWLERQDVIESETIRRLIDAEIARQEMKKPPPK